MKRPHRWPVLVALAAAGTGLFLGFQCRVFPVRAVAQTEKSYTPPDNPFLAPAMEPPTFPHVSSPSQVMFDVVIMEIDAAKLHAKGFHLERELGVEDRPRSDPATPSPIVATLGRREFRLLTRSLELAEAAKVLAEPSLVTTENKVARVHVGGELPLLSVERTVNGKRTTSLDTQAFGTIVEIQPFFVRPDVLRCGVTAESSRLVKDANPPKLVSRKLEVLRQMELEQVLIVAEPEKDTPPLGDGPPAAPAETLLLVAITAHQMPVNVPADSADNHATAPPATVPHRARLNGPEIIDDLSADSNVNARTFRMPQFVNPDATTVIEAVRGSLEGRAIPNRDAPETPLRAPSLRAANTQTESRDAGNHAPSLRAELNSLRDEVHQVRTDVHRILKLLEQSGDDEATPLVPDERPDPKQSAVPEVFQDDNHFAPGNQIAE
jgi:hypothetical protein